MIKQEVQEFVGRMVTLVSSLDEAHEQGTCDIDCYLCDCGL